MKMIFKKGVLAPAAMAGVTSVGSLLAQVAVPEAEFQILRPEFRMEEPSAHIGPLVSALSALSAPSSMSALQGAPFRINVNYTGSDQRYRAAFDSAKATWEGIMPHYFNGRQNGQAVLDLTIEATVEEIDGPGTILGSAGPTVGATDDANFVLATEGTMRFDSADFDSSNPNDLAFFEDVVLHEMGHVLGIGTLWGANGLYDSNAASVTDTKTLPSGVTYDEQVGRYTGAGALEGYQAEFGQGGLTYVPVEKGGGSGTENGHWDEGDGGNATGRISLITGEDMSGELMTGWANGGLYISNVTRGGLRDLGYDATVLAVPEPGSALLLLSGSLIVMGRRKRG